MRTVASIVFGIIGGIVVTPSASAAEPLLLEYRTEGTGYATAWSTSAGVGAKLGSDANTCHHSDPNGDYSKKNSLVVRLDARDGGYVTLSYRFKSWYPTLGVHQNAFTITVRDADTGKALEEPLLLWDYFAPVCELRDTGWVNTSIYIRPASDGSPRRELWLTIQGTSVGYYASDPTYTGTYTNSVEIDELAAVCSGSSSASAAAPTWSIRVPGSRQARPMKRVAGSASPVTGSCKGCCIKPLTPLDESDTDSVTMENGYDPWFWLPRCTADIQQGTECFRDTVEAAGHRFALTSTLRTEWYQKHFTEIWDKYADLKSDTTPECATIRSKVVHEMETKHVIRWQPARFDPKHVIGQAIDVSAKKMRLTVEQADDFAGACGLYRRVPGDKVHYEVKP